MDNCIDGLREVARNNETGQPLDNDLGFVLKRLFPKEEWLYNEPVKKKNGKSVTIRGKKDIKPDFRCDNLKLIIEFDGAGGRHNKHYCSAKKIFEDKAKVNAYQEAGYTVISIPSYIQLDKEMRDYYFKGRAKDVDTLYEAEHEHGFLHPQITLPADFCELGIERFKNELEAYPKSVKHKIIETLKERIADFEKQGMEHQHAVECVLPRSLSYLIS